jgi:glutamyl-Q tRNA(Asp) synthetase
MPRVGRFAPSPTGPLHAGSLVAALASWLDARAGGGRWLVRIEDVDRPRCHEAQVPVILTQLAACGLMPDAPPWRQSARSAVYGAALARLASGGLVYPCGCSRADIGRALAAAGVPPTRFAERPYPGTCRPAVARPPPQEPAWGEGGAAPAAWRFRVPEGTPAVVWRDRRLGAQVQDVAAAVGDFVLKRADGCFAYQLAVVVDDAAQGVTDIVRGADLADNTARQALLHRALGTREPSHLHVPLVLGADGRKLSKQNGAAAVALGGDAAARRDLEAAATVLGLPRPAPGAALAEALATWTLAWRDAWGPGVGAPGAAGIIRRPGAAEAHPEAPT